MFSFFKTGSIPDVLLAPLILRPLCPNVPALFKCLALFLKNDPATKDEVHQVLAGKLRACDKASAYRGCCRGCWHRW